VSPDQIFAILASLVSGAADPDFDVLRDGGFDPRYPVAVERCELPPGTLEVEGKTLVCGTVSVPEDYDAPDGRRIPLKFAILKARSLSPAPDPVLYLHGGPGSGTLQILGPLADRLFAKHRSTRDIVTFDQRAAALSATTVSCHEDMADHIVELVRVSKAKLPESALGEMVAPCVEEIVASGADLPAYNTENNARDVRALMTALGYPEYNLYGISYGTRLALEVLRTAPDGVRAVVIDGNAPPTVKLYDDLLGPYADALDALIDQCDRDEACAAAYPDLATTVKAAFRHVTENPIPATRGLPAIDADLLFGVTFSARNSWREQMTITPYLPRIYSELAVGKSDTIDALIASEPDPSAELVSAPGLTDDERALMRAALEAAEAMGNLEEGTLAVIEQLKKDLSEDRETTSVAEAFEVRSNAAVAAMEDRDAVVALVRDYALLQSGPKDHASLVRWVQSHFDGSDREDLMNLILAMSDADIARTFEIADQEATKYELLLGSQVNTYIYACQEDRPWNSPEGFDARTKELAQRWPFLDNPNARQLIDGFFAGCAAFGSHPREGFQTPVASDLPVLVLNGLLDVQTSWKWGELAAETLSNARNYVIPEAGHGTIAYQACPSDISVAFLNDPSAELDTSCIEKLQPKFVAPDDPLPF
jgi:pimeloyl-ACP methyl ester carboxylesterase